LIINSQGKKILTRPYRPIRNGRAQNLCATIGYQDGAVRLAGDFSRFQNQRTTTPIYFLTRNIEHPSFLQNLRCVFASTPTVVCGQAIPDAPRSFISRSTIDRFPNKTCLAVGPVARLSNLFFIANRRQSAAMFRFSAAAQAA
jgi:hypothetical protein